MLETTIGGVLREAAELAPDAAALGGGTPDPACRRRWDYAGLLSDGEPVAELEYVLGQSRAHGIVLAPGHRGNDLAETLVLAGWEAFVASGSPTERLPEVGPDQAAQILFTSGTTGFGGLGVVRDPHGLLPVTRA